MKYSIALLIALFSLAGCGDSKQESQSQPVTAADSMKLANKVYTESMTDLSDKKDIRDLLCQAWELEDDIDVIKNNNEAQGVYPFRSFYFSTDSTFVKNPRNFMEHGRWVFNEAKKTIQLSNSNGSKDEYKIAAIGPRELIVINSGQESITQLKFVAAGKRHTDKKNDPFHIDNNRWRIKPRFSENDSLIKKRLKDCLHFYILFYRDNLAKEDNVISFYGLPTCIKWYAGGIFLVKEKELAENWFECFYSRPQAMKAYAMMDAVISKKYTWSKERMSWVKKNLLVLEQMHDSL